jgi:hypothetical protein
MGENQLNQLISTVFNISSPASRSDDIAITYIVVKLGRLNGYVFLANPQSSIQIRPGVTTT